MKLDTVYNEDCLTFLKKLDTDSVDFVLTSPPYNIGIDYDCYNDNVEWSEYYTWCEQWLTECYRVLKRDGRIAVNHYMSLGNSKFRTSPLSHIYTIMEHIGFKHHALTVWQDRTLAKATAWGSWMSASSPYINSPFEGVLIDYKDSWKKNSKGVSTICKEDFIKMTRGVADFKTETRGLSKANFSVDFATKFINLLTFEGDVVLDPFMGSGTTGVACKLLNRRFIGCELSPSYTDIAVHRINSTAVQSELFGSETES